MDQKNRLLEIDAILDDLQSSVEAGSREADHVRTYATEFDRLFNIHLRSAELVGSMVRHAKELQVCARDQRAALQELRTVLAGLREELKSSRRALRPPSLAADRSKR